MYYNKYRLLFTGAGSYDADAQTFFTGAGITSTTEKDAYSAFVVGLKSDGVYSKLVTFHPFFGSNLTSKVYNAINPSTGLITFSNMNSVSGGVTTGTAFGVGSFTTPSSGVTANDAGFGAYSTQWSSIISGKNCFIGKVGNSVDLYVVNGTSLYYVWNVTGNYTPSTMNKLISIQATTISGAYATRSYVNNNAWLHKTSQNSTVPTGTFVFGDLDDAGQSVTFGCHYTSLGLTSAEHVLLNTRINTLMTAVGR